MKVDGVGCSSSTLPGSASSSSAVWTFEIEVQAVIVTAGDIGANLDLVGQFVAR